MLREDVALVGRVDGVATVDGPDPCALCVGRVHAAGGPIEAIVAADIGGHDAVRGDAGAVEDGDLRV